MSAAAICRRAVTWSGMCSSTSSRNATSQRVVPLQIQQISLVEADGLGQNLSPGELEGDQGRVSQGQFRRRERAPRRSKW